MLEFLIREHGWKEHYSDPAVDWFSRLPADAPAEDRFEHFLDHVDVEHDDQSGTLTVRVRAISSEKAYELGQAILAASERMVNELSERARSDRIALARQELERAERRLTKARQDLRELQAQRGELDPTRSAAGLLEVRSRLEAELAIARAELSTLSGDLQPDAPAVVQQRRRVAALQRQIEEQTRRLSGSEAEDIADAIASFEPVVIEKEFAQRAYESALTSLELARVDATRQHRYLVRVAGPSRPDDATYPNFWYSVLTVLVLSFALLGIVTLVVASVREHANV
jgi:capsular polysaccharide transport system permease protein